MQVSMTMEDFKALEAARDEAQARAAVLERQLVEAKLDAGNTTTIRSLTMLARALLSCTRFAVGQLPPETTKHWPVRDLRIATGLLAVLPDYNVQDDHGIQTEFEAFAKEIDRCEEVRAENVVINKILEGSPELTVTTEVK